MFKTYSMLVNHLREKIDATTVDISAVTFLIQQSYDAVSSEAADEASKKLHNMLLAKFLKQHPELQVSLDGFYYAPDLVTVLEQQFQTDPSNFSIVLQLAVKYSELGRDKRAKQLLNRLIRSEYKEKNLALKFMQERYGDE